MKKRIQKIISFAAGLALCFSSINTGALIKANSESEKLSVTVYGDADCNDKVEIADAILVMQSCTNPDRYAVGKEKGITAQGFTNADVNMRGNGLNLRDALMIQKYLLGIINKLPESYMEGYEEVTTTTTTTTQPTTTSTTTSTTTTTTTTTQPTTTSTTTTTTTTTQPTTTSTTTTTTTTTQPTTTTTTQPITTSTTTSTTTTTTTTTQPTTTSTTTSTTTTTTTTTQPTTTSTTTSTTTTTTSTTTSTSTTTTTTTTTSTTSTTTTTTTSETTTSETTTSEVTTSEVSTPEYFYKYEDGYYWNPDDLVFGPDSNAELYNDFMETVKTYGIKNYKIVWCEEVIPYAYVAPGLESSIFGHLLCQAIPAEDLKYICEGYYSDCEYEGLDFYRCAFIRPEGYSTDSEHTECIDHCGFEHETIYNNVQMVFVLWDYWQLIPTDENGNDILELAGGSDYLKSLLNK